MRPLRFDRRTGAEAMTSFLITCAAASAAERTVLRSKSIPNASSCALKSGILILTSIPSAISNLLQLSHYLLLDVPALRIDDVDDFIRSRLPQHAPLRAQSG